MSYAISCDFGYGYCKLFDGMQCIQYKSILANASKISYSTNFSAKEELKYMSIKVVENGVNLHFYVADMALQQGREIVQILDSQKFSNNLTKILMQTGIGLFMRNKAVKNLDIVTGLPISFYNDANMEAVNKLLKGQHEITFDWSILKKPDQKVNFTVDNVYVIPQPVGTLYNLILDKNGNIINKELASKTIGIIDIGFGTSDFAVFRQLEYIGRSSKSVNKAVKDVCINVIDYLCSETGETLDVHEIEKVLIKKEISVRGKHYDLTQAIDAATKSVFNQLQAQQRILFASERDLDTYIVCGGGAYLFADLFTKSFGKDISILIPEQAQLSNCFGFARFYSLMNRTKVQ